MDPENEPTRQEPVEVASDSTRIVDAEPAVHPVHTGPSTADMARSSQRARRRERDARAERTTQRTLIGGVMALGVVALVAVNMGVFDALLESAPAPPAGPGPSANPPKPSPPQLSAAPVENADLPALRALEREGLTIVAEGLPEVFGLDADAPPETLVGIETCRYAFAIWEFSPNKRFRFLSTCELFEGEVLAGAWQIDGPTVLMSPLAAVGTTLVSRFSAESPSRMETDVTVEAAGAVARLRVRQRITGMRPGLNGDGFLSAYRPKNTVKVRGIRTTAPPPSAPIEAPPKSEKREPPRDPILDLLEP